MTDARVQLYETAGNLSLVRVDGRRFPGLLIQGDSLKIMSDLVLDLGNELSAMNCEIAQDSLTELSDAVLFMVKEYERMMANANLGLPYSS